MSLGPATLDVGHELCDQFFRFALAHMIRFGNIGVLSAADGTADHRRQASLLRTRDGSFHRGTLHDHATEENEISPIEVRVLERSYVHIDQPALPGRRQQWGHTQQAQRREGRALALKRQGVLETPKRVREFRVHEQDLHGSSSFSLGVAHTFVSRSVGAGSLVSVLPGVRD